MITKPSKIRPLFMQCSIYFFILHLLLQFSFYASFRRSSDEAITPGGPVADAQYCEAGEI